MPRSPNKPCPRTLPSGRQCPRLIPAKDRACMEHQQQSMREWDELRGSAASRGYNSRHRRWRAVILKRDPYCRIQMKCSGAPSTVADHIQPVEKGGGWTYENGQGCCDDCHNWKRGALDKRGITMEQWREEQMEAQA